jgi:hypothetical protein
MSEQAIPFVLKRGARDGCGCGKWVERCVHFDGRFVQLCRIDGLTDAEIAATWNYPFSVDVPPDATGAAMGMVSMVLSKHHDYDAAVAAFDAAELALLRGGDA